LSSTRIISKQKRIPAPIKICSNYADFDEPHTAICSHALPFSSTPNSWNARNKLVTPQRAAPTPPMDQPSSILVLSAPSSARKMPTLTEHGSRPPRKELDSKTANSKEPKNVPFVAVQSSALSNLKSPAHINNSRRSLSPMPYSPKTLDVMLFEDPDIVPESPIEDAPMLSITPIEDMFQEKESQAYTSISSFKRGRQFDPETFLLLTGRKPSSAAYERGSAYLIPYVDH
jgi:hypothetical protein